VNRRTPRYLSGQNFLWMIGDPAMKATSTIVSLFIAVCMPLSASAAIAMPLSASSSLRDGAAAPMQMVRHRQSRTLQHHRAAPSARDNNGYGTSSRNGVVGNDDWSHWSPSHHPGWPCIGSGSDASQTSAYPAWEMKPGCQ
jgi:hypothetical protein